MAKAKDTTEWREIPEAEKVKDEARHKKKREALDKLIVKARKKQDRMERINPIGKRFPALSVEEVEKIEAKLVKSRDFTDEELIKAVAGVKDVSKEEAEDMITPDIEETNGEDDDNEFEGDDEDVQIAGNK